VQIMSQDLHRMTQAALRDAGLAPGRLELEITESIFLHEVSSSMAILRSLRDTGVRIALDDFGTGYSSLAYLRRFPFDTLKIDRSFVRELTVRSDLRAIVKMIIAMAHTLNMTTVAEGVEEVAQAQALDHYGCDRMQGYLVAQALPAGEIAAFLAAWGQVPRPGDDAQGRAPQGGRSALAAGTAPASASPGPRDRT
jgi:EAL domain-containing protein (putative c-di-GMP-specific phosphodiesterase class I)